MKRSPAFLLCILTASVLFAAAPPDEGFGLRIERYLANFAALHPRLEAGEGERKARDFILAELAARKVKAEERDFSAFNGGHSFSKNVEVRFPGLKADTILIAVPLAQEPETKAGEDGSASLALALALAAEYGKRSRRRLTLQFLFLGGETGSSSSDFLGTRLFLQDYFPETPQAVLYFNLKTLAAGLGLGTGARGIVSPGWLVERLAGASKLQAVPLAVSGSAVQIHRLGIPGPRTAVETYLKAGYPAVSFESAGPGATKDPKAWSEDFLKLFQGFLALSEPGLPEDWDSHYLVFSSDRGNSILGERTLLVVLLAVLACSIIYALVFRIHARKYLLTFFRHFWNLPVIFGLNFAFLLAGTLIVEAVSAYRGSPDLWTHSPFIFFGLKLSATVFLSALTFHQLRRLRISRNGSFYSAAAIIVFLLDVFIFSFINLSFCYYFLWAYIGALAFSRVKNRVFKVLILLAASVWLGVIAYDAFSVPELELAKILIRSQIHGNLLLAFIVLPFFLLAIRLDLLVRHPVKGKSGFGLKILTAFTFLLSLGLGGFALGFNPYRASPQPLEVTETWDVNQGTRLFRLASPFPLGDFELLFGGKTYTVSTKEREATFAGEGIPVERNYRLRSSLFLDRKAYDLTLLPVPATREVSLELSSPKDLLLYASDLPYSLDLSGRKAVIHVGRNPPSPLTFSLTLPAELEPDAEVVYTSPRLSRDLFFRGKAFQAVTTFRLKESFRLKTDG